MSIFHDFNLSVVGIVTLKGIVTKKSSSMERNVWRLKFWSHCGLQRDLNQLGKLQHLCKGRDGADGQITRWD